MGAQCGGGQLHPVSRAGIELLSISPLLSLHINFAYLYLRKKKID